MIIQNEGNMHWCKEKKYLRFITTLQELQNGRQKSNAQIQVPDRTLNKNKLLI